MPCLLSGNQATKKSNVRAERMSTLLSMVFVNLNGLMPELESYKVRYDPYTMDYFQYKRIVNGTPEWLELIGIG